MSKTRFVNGNNRGSALFFSILLTSVLIIFGVSFLSMVHTQSKLMFRSHAGFEALNVAEAGVELAIWELGCGGGDFTMAEGWVGTNPITRSATLNNAAGNPIGTYDITVIIGSDDVNISSVGSYPDSTNPLAVRTVKVRLSESNIFTKAISSMQEIKFGNNNYMDSYNSDLGAYGGTNISANADFITNSTKTMAVDGVYAIDVGNSIVHGDLYVGPGGDPAQAINTSGATINGALGVSDRYMRFSRINPPVGLPDNGNLQVNPNGTYTINASGSYDSIDLKNKATLIFDGDITVYVDGAFTTGTQVNIQVTPTANVHLVVNGATGIDIGSQSTIDNQSNDPRKFTIYGTNNVTSFMLMPNSQFYGNVYMPNADFQIQPNTTVYGAVAGKKVTFQNNVTVHFDESLATSDAAPQFTSYIIENWQAN